MMTPAQLVNARELLDQSRGWEPGLVDTATIAGWLARTLAALTGVVALVDQALALAEQDAYVHEGPLTDRQRLDAAHAAVCICHQGYYTCPDTYQKRAADVEDRAVMT
jgi:hypothetical protein